MAIELIGKMKPKNNGTFALMDAADVEMPDGKRLSELDLSVGRDGEDGLTPFIGANGNWWIGETDTGTPASGNGGGGGSSALPAVTEEDNGKFLRVVDGAWAATSTENVTMLLDDQELSFAFDSTLGVYSASMTPAPFILVIGETYKVKWGEEEYTCVAMDGSAITENTVFIGNAAPFGLNGNNEPFVIGGDTLGISTDFFSLVDTAPTTRKVTIWKEDAIATESFVRTYVEQYISEALGGDY